MHHHLSFHWKSQNTISSVVLADQSVTLPFWILRQKCDSQANPFPLLFVWRLQLYIKAVGWRGASLVSCVCMLFLSNHLVKWWEITNSKRLRLDVFLHQCLFLPSVRAGTDEEPEPNPTWLTVMDSILAVLSFYGFITNFITFLAFWRKARDFSYTIKLLLVVSRSLVLKFRVLKGAGSQLVVRCINILWQYPQQGFL